MSEKLNIRNTVKTARQESSVFLQGGVRVNDAFWYDVSEEYPNQIGIHLFPMDVGESIGERKAALTLYKKGLNELAHRMEADPKLKDIKQVTGWSKLVYEHPNLLKMLGFEVAERDDEKKEALAIMKREEFLKEYGTVPDKAQ